MKGGHPKRDSESEDTFMVAGAPFPTCLRQAPKSTELARGLAKAPAGFDVSMWDVEQSLGADALSPCAAGHEASLLP